MLNTIVPSQNATTGTGDITTRFAGSGRFYGGILRLPGSLRLNILRSTNFAAPTVMSVLVDRTNVDQPYTQAATVPSGTDAGKDRVYVGLNDFAASGGRTATVETCLDAAAASAVATSVRVEKRGTGTAGQNGPQVRPAVHTDGTVYTVFYGWRAFSAASLVTSDVVVVRDDNWGKGASAVHGAQGSERQPRRTPGGDRRPVHLERLARARSPRRRSFDRGRSQQQLDRVHRVL